MNNKLIKLLIVSLLIFIPLTTNAQTVSLDNMTGVITVNDVKLKSEVTVPLEIVNSSLSIRENIENDAKIEARFSSADEQLIIDKRTENNNRPLDTIILQVDVSHLSDNLDIDFVSKEGNKTAKRLKPTEEIDSEEGRAYIFRLLSLDLESFVNDAIFLEFSVGDNVFLNNDLFVTVSLFVDSVSLVPDPDLNDEEFGEETEDVSSLVSTIIEVENDAQLRLDDLFISSGSLKSRLIEILNGNEIEKENLLNLLNDVTTSLESAKSGLKRLKDIIKQAVNNKDLDKSTAKKSLNELGCAFRQDKEVIGKTKKALNKLNNPQTSLQSSDDRGKFVRMLNSARGRLIGARRCKDDAFDLLKEKGFLENQ